MLDGAVAAARIGADLDAVLSVDTIRIYKPRREVYALVTDAFGVAPAEVAFVSSNRWDVMGATAFGFTCVWVNRAGLPEEYPELAPVAVVRDLASLATLDSRRPQCRVAEANRRKSRSSRRQAFASSARGS